jgi:VIT1/CCC1 family predicted Fe2+/Mn2+ transporter
VRALSEKVRISRLSRIRELVLGFQDGLLVPLAVVTGLAAADFATITVIVGGLAEAAAGALAMGTASFLASQAENQLFESEIKDEEAQISEHPEVERLELEMLLREEKLTEEDARLASEVIARSRASLKKTMLEKELGLSYMETNTELKDAIVVGLSYSGAALVPLWPYLLWHLNVALPISLITTALALFLLGVVKGRVARMALFRSGIQVLCVGGSSAAIGYIIGVIAPRLFG